MRDLRDPRCVGHKLLSIAEGLRVQRPSVEWPLATVADMSGLACPIWTGDGFMSNNPAEHHSKTPQDGVGTKFGSPSSQGFSE